jgi:hypothetical protein
MNRLEKCTGCARHVRVTEEACPFCQTVLPASFREPRARPSVGARFGRIALIAAGAAAVAVPTVACSSDDDDNPNMVVEYGVPPDLHLDGGGSADAAPDAPLAIASYGTVVGIALDGGDDEVDSSLGDGGGDAAHEDFDGGDAD